MVHVSEEHTTIVGNRMLHVRILLTWSIDYRYTSVQGMNKVIDKDRYNLIPCPDKCFTVKTLQHYHPHLSPPKCLSNRLI